LSVELFRIDDRLIHGQVVVGWGQTLGIAFIVLVDDEVRANDWEQELYRMGVPPDVSVVFASAEEAAAQLAAWQADPRRGIVLTGDVGTMSRLVAATHGAIRRVNVGGIHYRDGRRERLRYVYLGDDEARALESLSREGVDVSAQDVPTGTSVPLAALLG
jgi:PTS system mannose-specific IIB component/fructoselysine and glucoselysine-specific PTS system IIB component